jgi:hypothetical protein
MFGHIALIDGAARSRAGSHETQFLCFSRFAIAAQSPTRVHDHVGRQDRLIQKRERLKIVSGEIVVVGAGIDDTPSPLILSEELRQQDDVLPPQANRAGRDATQRQLCYQKMAPPKKADHEFIAEMIAFVASDDSLGRHSRE